MAGNYFAFWQLLWVGIYAYSEYKLMLMVLSEVERGLTPHSTLDSCGVLVLS